MEAVVVEAVVVEAVVEAVVVVEAVGEEVHVVEPGGGGEGGIGSSASEEAALAWKEKGWRIARLHGAV